ncbi:hypothetical protein [Streptomyces sp. NPDC046385]|uniref:hypothetical protein n=1 Tax=unclassified Streptomyces TaxID=2593676 RepID=UPI0033E91C41
MLARLRRLCEALGVPLVVTDGPWPPPAAVASLQQLFELTGTDRVFLQTPGP